VRWDYRGIPKSITPGETIIITVTGGVESESPKGAGDGLALSGVVSIGGDIVMRDAQQADRGHKIGKYEFVVNPNAKLVTIDIGGAPMGTAAKWVYK
jgi:hypothetical protein